jgi:hypothetical protein
MTPFHTRQSRERTICGAAALQIRVCYRARSDFASAYACLLVRGFGVGVDGVGAAEATEARASFESLAFGFGVGRVVVDGDEY